MCNFWDTQGFDYIVAAEEFCMSVFEKLNIHVFFQQINLKSGHGIREGLDWLTEHVNV